MLLGLHGHSALLLRGPAPPALRNRSFFRHPVRLRQVDQIVTTGHGEEDNGNTVTRSRRKMIAPPSLA
jgi:hypothetical protein